MFRDTKIYTHRQELLKEYYMDIYLMLKGIKTWKPEENYAKNLNYSFYTNIILTNPKYPKWLKFQMCALVRRKINNIKDKSVLKKTFDFRLILPRKQYNIISCYIPDDMYIRHSMFDSRNMFVDLCKKKSAIVKVF